MSWENYKIGDFLTRSKEPVKIKQQEEYTLVTIRMYHKGVAKRSHVKGSSIKSPTLYKVRAGQFILSGIDARNRAFGIVPEELEGAIVTNDFWTHNIDTSIIDINFFYWFTTTPQFYDACIKASEGTTNRQRLQADKFYSFDVFLPSIDEQKEWVERISNIQNKHEQLDKELYQQQTYLQLLRQTILQEAVQGKLTKQDPTDEPATELLKRIKAEKEKLIKAGKLKKEKGLPPITEDEIPFELPEGWVWCRLGDMAYVGNGSTPDKKEFTNISTDIPYLKVYNIVNQKVNFQYKPQYIKKACHEGQLKRSISFAGDVLMNIVGPPLGKIAIVPKEIPECNINQAIVVIRPFIMQNNQWIYWFLCEKTAVNAIVTKGTAGQDNISVTQSRNIVFPLPPLAEQQRLVAKVQQLQQQLSQLEAHVQQSRQYAQQLLQSVLKEAFEQNTKVYEMEEEVSMVAEGN